MLKTVQLDLSCILSIEYLLSMQVQYALLRDNGLVVARYDGFDLRTYELQCKGIVREETCSMDVCPVRHLALHRYGVFIFSKMNSFERVCTAQRTCSCTWPRPISVLCCRNTGGKALDKVLKKCSSLEMPPQVRSFFKNVGFEESSQVAAPL